MVFPYRIAIYLWYSLVSLSVRHRFTVDRRIRRLTIVSEAESRVCLFCLAFYTKMGFISPIR